MLNVTDQNISIDDLLEWYCISDISIPTWRNILSMKSWRMLAPLIELNARYVTSAIYVSYIYGVTKH